jgi:hypothetical protein
MPLEFKKEEQPSIGMQMLQEAVIVIALAVLASSVYLFYFIEWDPFLGPPILMALKMVGPAMFIFYLVNQRSLEKRKKAFRIVFLTVMWLSLGVTALLVAVRLFWLFYDVVTLLLSHAMAIASSA